MCKFRNKKELLKIFGLFYAISLVVLYIITVVAIFMAIPIFIIIPSIMSATYIISAWWLILPVLGGANFVLCSNSIFVIIFHKVDKYLYKWI